MHGRQPSAACSLWALAVWLAAAPVAAAADPTTYVDPFIGTGGHGHTYPGATVPFGMVQLSPDTHTRGWDWCSGYDHSDRSIIGFSHTHLSGTGVGDLGDILLMPTTGKLQLSAGTRRDPDAGYRSRFSHAEERASPGYYAVRLADTGIRAELTATSRAGLHRYTFPASDTAHVVIDLVHGINDKPVDLALRIHGRKTITGYRRSSGWAKDQVVYFAAEFSKPFSAFGTAVGDRRPREGSRRARGRHVKGFVSFKTRAGEKVLVRVGISAVSVRGALRNLKKEIPRWDFDAVRAAARRRWRAALARVRLQGARPEQRTIFYTALYHAMLAPTLFSDVDGRYRGGDRKVHRARGFANYSTFSLWDTFRAAHALYTILEPRRVGHMVRAMIAHARQHEKHLLPIWTLQGNETYCMIGRHALPVIAEAHAKSIIGGSVARAAYGLMRENARRNDWYARYGYIPADRAKESVSKTLELAYDDWAVARMAKRLGRTADHALFVARAAFYKNLFDRDTGFMRGRLQDGSWREPFVPHAVNVPGKPHDFTEGSSWQYSWFVPHDVAGLIALMGGRAPFVRKLDALFSTKAKLGKHVEDVSGLIGQYAHGNEPSHHIAYLYSYAGAPWKTQQRVRRIRSQLYHATPNGLSGNEDCGQMSAWYVFSALGFYPVDPVSATYVLGAPAFRRATLALPDGKRFTVEAPALGGRNRHVQRVLLDGKPLARTWIRHAEIVAGGTLRFEMGPHRGKWGRAPSAAPPSMSSAR